jgi:hypothetical protein
LSNPLTFILPLRYDRVRRVLVVQTGPAAQIPMVVRSLKGLFPGALLEVLMREQDARTRDDLEVTEVRVARYEERFEVLGQLRRHRYDVVAMQMSREMHADLRLLPFVARTRAIFAFNDQGDYFPLSVFRLDALAQHLGGRGGGLFHSFASLLKRAVRAAVLGPLGFLCLLLATGKIQLRGAWRRMRRRLHGEAV